MSTEISIIRDQPFPKGYFAFGEAEPDPTALLFPWVDLVRITSQQGATCEENRQMAFIKCVEFAKEVFAPQGFVANIFATEVSKTPNLDLWGRYEKEYALELSWKAPILEKKIPKWFRTYSVGTLAGNSIQCARVANFEKGAYCRIFFSLESMHWDAEKIQELHDAAYRRMARELGTPISIRALVLARHLFVHRSISLFNYRIDDSSGYIYELMMASGSVKLP